MSWFKRKEPFTQSGWGNPDDPDTRTRDVVHHLSFEITRVVGLAEQLQDLVDALDKDKDKNT